MPVLQLDKTDLIDRPKQEPPDTRHGINTIQSTPPQPGLDKLSGPAPVLSIVIPVFNEEGSILQLIREINDALTKYCDYEIIVVDDGSNDSTLKKLKDLLLSNRQLRILSHHKNYGQSAALNSGICAARAEWIVTLDGDGQNDPKDIIKLHQALVCSGEKQQLKLVCGYRKKRNDNFIKRISSRIANKIRSAFLNDGVIDTGCGIKLIHKKTFLTLPYFDHMHRFIPALVIRAGGKIKTLEVNHRPREHGKSKYGINNRLWVGIIDMLGVFWLMHRGDNIKLEEVNKNDN